MADESARWRVLTPEPARVILVGPATASALAQIPGAAHALMTALVQQVERERELRAIVGIQRIEDRIVAFFRPAGAPRRRVAEDRGVRIPLALEQKRIEEILSAGHTQATMAFRVAVRRRRARARRRRLAVPRERLRVRLRTCRWA